MSDLGDKAFVLACDLTDRLLQERDDLVKALEPFANGIITPDGVIIGLMREDVARARDVIARVKGVSKP
jgi:hypothetical protein